MPSPYKNASTKEVFLYLKLGSH